MPMPVGIATVTLTGRYVRPDGTPLVGSVTIASPALLTLPNADTIAAGSVTVNLTPEGEFSIVLVATDNAGMQPDPGSWRYAVTETFQGIPTRTYHIDLPSTPSTVNLADIAPADPAMGDYIVIEGPQGPAGNTILSGNGAPSNATGANGDFWLDLTAYDLYGPKASGVWPTPGVALGGGGGGSLVTSVNGLQGAVVLDAGDVGADTAGSAAAAETAALAYTDDAIDDEVIRADAAYVHADDSRMTNARTPTAHAASHASAGSDPITPASIGAATQAAHTALADSVTDIEARTTDVEAEVAALNTSGWRRRDIADPAMADPLYSGTAPTVSTTQTTTSTISGAVKYAPPLVTLAGSDVRGDFLFVGGSDFQIGAVSPDTNYALPTSRYPHTYATPQHTWGLEFVTDADVFELRFKYIGTQSRYRLSIDGKPVTATAQSVGGTTAGSGHMLKVDFGSSAVRRVRVDLYTVPFGGIYINSAFALWRPIARQGRFLVLGDSISDGSAENTAFGQGTWIHKTARMLGVVDWWDQARGGTGYITASTSATFGDRVSSDVVAYKPERVVIFGGYNDSGGVQADIATAAASVFSAVKSGLPAAEIYVIGCWCPTAVPASSITATDDTIKAAAQVANLPFISPVTGEVRNGAGTLITTPGAWITSANVAAVIGSDGVHPTDAGHTYIARRITDALASLMPA